MSLRTILALVVLGVILSAAAWNMTREKPIRVSVSAVERGEVRWAVSNTRAGTVDACQRARMAPLLHGRIASLPVKEGDQVEKGQILMQLWNEDLIASLAFTHKQRLAAGARADEACTAASFAQRESGRISRLYVQGLTSEENADLASSEARAKEAACEAMKNMIEVSEAQVQLAQAQLEQTMLRAPFNGTVAEINGEVGEVVTPSPVGVLTLPAVDLIDQSCLYVTAPIDEVDAPAVRAGMKALISMDAFPEKTFPATIRRVAPYVMDLEKQARTVDIEAEFDEPGDNLLPGYSADVEITIDVRSGVLRVPTQAVINDREVLVLDEEGVLRARPIESGLRNWQFTEVINGIQEKDRIVLSVDREGVAAGVTATAETGH
jgi:HlyD family secretion protein